MAITVTTTGPLSTAPSVLIHKDKTFSDLHTVISDEIDDTTSEYSQQIQNAIFSAIRLCEREPLYFNESREITFSTLKGQAWYDEKDNRNIATASGIRSVFLDRKTGAQTRLKYASPDELEVSTNEHGEPYSYTYFNRKLCLYPTPDQTYQIRLLLEPIKLAEITSPNQESPWFTEAFDLIKARAKYELYKDILKDSVMAQASFNDFTEQLASLKAETSRRTGSNMIKSTVF